MMTDKERAQKLFGNAIYNDTADSYYFSRNREDQSVFDAEMENRSEGWTDVVVAMEDVHSLIESVKSDKIPNYKVQGEIMRSLHAIYKYVEDAYDNV